MVLKEKYCITRYNHDKNMICLSLKETWNWQDLNLTLITEPNLCEIATGVNEDTYFVTCFENSS